MIKNQDELEKQSVRDKYILNSAIQALRESTGIRAQVDQAETGTSDYTIEIYPPGKSTKKRLVFNAEVKQSLTQSTLGEIFIQTKNIGKKFVAVTEHVTSPQAELLRNLDIAFFDTCGNAYFSDQGLYIYINTGKSAVPAVKRSVKVSATEKLLTKESGNFRRSDLKILFALLCNPNLEKENYRTIAVETNVALGSVSRHMNKLKESGFLEEDQNGQRQLIRKSELFKLWVEGFIIKLRSNLLFARFETSAPGRWWEKVDLKKFEAYWGGETAAEKITGYLKPEIVMIYADNVLPRLQAEYGLKRKPDGDVEILQKFWAFKTENNIAPPLLVYADLVASGDSRNLETAKKIYDEYLDRLVGDGAG